MKYWFLISALHNLKTSPRNGLIFNYLQHFFMKLASPKHIYPVLHPEFLKELFLEADCF